MKIKRFLIAVTAIASLLNLCVCAYPIQSESTPEITSKYALMIDINSGTVLYEKDADEKIYPASLAKIAAGLIAVENKDKFDTVTVENTMLWKVQGNNIGLMGKEEIPYEELLYALITRNANDAAYVISNVIAGDSTSFVKLMNKKAKELGAENTNFSNPTGMHDEKMVTTLRDISKICLAAYSNKDYMKYCGEASHTIEKTNKYAKRTLVNSNKMLINSKTNEYYLSGVNGMNSGSTPEAGLCLAVTRTIGNVSTLVLISGGKEINGKNSAYIDAMDLFSYQAKYFKNIEVIPEGNIILEKSVELASNTDHVILTADEPVSIYLPTFINYNEYLKYEYKLNSDTFQAPIKKGDQLGTLDVYFDGEYVKTVNLVAQYSIKRSNIKYILYKVTEFLKSPATVISVIVLTVAFIIYTCIYVFKVKRSKKQKKN